VKVCSNAFTESCGNIPNKSCGRLLKPSILFGRSTTVILSEAEKSPPIDSDPSRSLS
jgi:hypothetical protein